jgi:UDP-glucose 4-epimerase
MIVIVTGASGYIGGEIALKLADGGHTVVGIDLRPCPEHLKLCFEHFIQEDFANDEVLNFIANAKADAIIHCAGTSLVGPSVINPQEYYHNNIVKTLKLLDTMIKIIPRTRIIFSSSAAVYGTPIMVPCSEVDPCEPISPYGETKLAVEWMLRGYHQAYGLDYVAFRYFNAAGADSQARHGQESCDTHIIPRVLESVKNNTEFTLYGNDYDTPDGTCIRDYVHVEDIADAHILALEQSVPAGIYNIGTNKGTSNLEIINQAAYTTGIKFPVIVKAKRDGDPSMLTAEANKFQAATGWSPRYTLQDIIKHAWAWHCK